MKKPLLIVAKMLLLSLFLNIYNFKLPRLKTPLTATVLDEKERSSQRLLVHSNVPSYKQVFLHAYSVLLM